MNPRERFAAYHEAGHAVMCVEERARLFRVSIVPDEVPGTDGHVRHADVFARIAPDIDYPNLTRTGIERLARVAIAGDIAVA
jgi:hypothetical protein